MIRVMGDRVLVKEDPKKKKSELVELLTNESNVITGEVVQVGNGKVNKHGLRVPPALSVGDRVAFFRWHKETKGGRAAATGVSQSMEGHVIVSTRDVLFVFDSDVEVDT